MSLLIGFLTFILVLNCLFLMLLILIQLPKKEAGAGIAFGGAATDALFGAGSGNALTKLTKYAGTTFVVMTLVLSVLNMNAARQSSRKLDQELLRHTGAAAHPTPALPSPLSGQVGASTTPPPSSPAIPAPAVTTTTNLMSVPAATQPTVSPEAPTTPAQQP